MAMTSVLNKQGRPEVVPSTPQLSLAGVTKQFGTSGFVALDGITIDIPQGQFFVIVGPSGCGKTTLLRILAGLDPHSAGTVVVNRTDEK